MGRSVSDSLIQIGEALAIIDAPRPSGGATRGVLDADRHGGVSIHAPARGATTRAWSIGSNAFDVTTFHHDDSIHDQVRSGRGPI